MKRFVVFVVLLLGAVLSHGARAQTLNKAQAYAQCVAAGPPAVAVQPDLRREPADGYCVLTSSTSTVWQCAFDFRYSTTRDWMARWGGCGNFSFVACPADAPWDEATHQCGSRCASAPQLTDAAFIGQSGGSACSGGCAYKPSTTATPHVEIGVDSNALFQGSPKWDATGQSCDVEQEQKPFDPTKETCSMNGTVLECVKPDGQHCVSTTIAGLTQNLCWLPDVTGERITKDGKFAANRVLAPNSSNVSISNQTNSTNISNSTTTVNNKTYNTSTFSGTGNSGGQGNTGTGNQNGEGGTGNGDGDSGDDDGPGAPSGDLGTLYEDPNLTAAGIAGEYFQKVMDTPIAGSIRTFMTVPTGGGSCPVFTLEASTFWEAQTLEFHCSGAILAALEGAGYLCLAIATYIAARIAFT